MEKTIRHYAFIRVEAVPGSIRFHQAVGTCQGPSDYEKKSQHSGAVIPAKQLPNSKGVQGSVHIDEESTNCCFE